MLMIMDFTSEVPIYLQLRNQVVLGIAKGELELGESLPPVRAMGDELGVNSMTISKAYQLLKEEGYITTDRRSGTRVAETISPNDKTKRRFEEQLTLLLAEAKVHGMDLAEVRKEIERKYASFEKGEE